MPDLLNTSLTGMLAFQRALQVTSHNITNANTPGYSRQVAEFTTRVGGGSGQNYVGGGTQISVVKRIYDQLLVEQLRTSATGQARFSALNSMAERIDTLLADADTGLSAGLQNYFNSIQDVSNDPGSVPIRQALLGEADAVANRFRTLDQRLETLESEVNDRLSLAVDDINRLASGIADMNDQIALAGVGAQPNDLLDQRDQMVLDLSQLVSVTTTIQEDGGMNVFIGNGQSLVLGNNVQRLGILANEFDPTRASVVYEGSAGVTALDTSLSGGTLGGLLEFRTRMLDSSRQALGQTAVTFVNQLNQQHSEGMDLRGNLGGDMYSIDPPTVLYSANAAGSGTAAATVADLGLYTGADYILAFDGAAYSLRRADTGQAVPMTGSGTVADPFLADGVAIEVGGAPAAGDRIMIRTGHNAAGSIQNAISDPRALAFAAPTRAQSSDANIGNATIGPATVFDSGDPALLASAVIEFTGPNSYSVNGAGSFAYTDGDPIIVNGTSVTISGTPAVGDQFTIEANYGALGDNSNALRLIEMQSAGVLDGGAISINDSYAQLVASVGSTTHQIQAGLDAQNVVYANAEEAVLSKSAVNLDEEAANLIRYQQAYQAAAQVVNVTKALFDSLLNATSR